jgi:hypothetical protein
MQAEAYVALQAGWAVPASAVRADNFASAALRALQVVSQYLNLFVAHTAARVAKTLALESAFLPGHISFSSFRPVRDLGQFCSARLNFELTLRIETSSCRWPNPKQHGSPLS